MALVKDTLGRETQPSSSSGGNAKSMSIGDLRKQEYSGVPVGTSGGQSGAVSRTAGRQKRIVEGNGTDVVAASNANPKNQEWKRSIRTAGSMVSETGKSVYDTMAEGELYYRQTGRQSDTIKKLMESDPYYETDRENYRKERDKKFELYEGKWQLASTAGQGSDQADPLEEFKGNTDYKVWDIKKNGFNGFDFTTVYNKYGNGYNLNREAIDWISNRFRASFEKYYDGYDEDQMRKAQGLMPRSTEYSYRRNSKDQQLLSLGLPPSSYIDDYVQDYIDWIGDGTYWAIQDGEANDWIVQQWQSTWKYETTPEDIERKRNGEMPYKVEQKYRKGSTGWGDITKSYADEMYLSMGLPPAADMDDLVGAYETHASNQNRIQQFYGTVAASWYKIGLDYGSNDTDVAYQTEDGVDVTVAQLREQAFIDTLNSDDFSDVRGLYRPVEATGEVDESKYTNDPLGLFDAQYKAEVKADESAEKLAGTDYVSYDDLLALYPGMRTEIGTQRVVDDAVIAARGENYTYADLEAELQGQRDAEMFASIGTKQDAIAYVDSVFDPSAENADPTQVLRDMFEGGTDFKHVRQAKNRLIGMYSAAAGNDNMVMRGRIMDTFDELKAENQKRTNAQIDAAAESDRSVAGNFGRMFLMTAGGMGTYDPEAYQAQAEKLVDVVGESKVAKDRFAVIDAPAKMLSDAYENGKTSAITKAEATELYASIIERDGNGNITPESEARAKQKLIDSGATGYMAESIAIETAAANGEDTSALYQSMIDNGADPEMARTAMLRYNATSHEAAPKKDPRLLAASEDDMRELIAIFRANVTADGTMTDYEVDQAFRANGYSNCLDPAESAAHYFVEVDFGRSLMATGTDEEKAAWQAATPQEQRAIATESMESWNDETRTAYTGWFAENQMVNPDVAKTEEEVRKYQGIAAVSTKALGGIVSGAVNLVDMGAALVSGRSERWQFTEEVTDFTNFITNYGRSNQSYLTEGIGLASDMGAEVLRMYMLNAAGAAIGSATGATKVGTAVSAVANSEKASRGMRFLANAGMYAVRSSPFVLTATGNYYSEAMEAGATAQQATWYAIVCGALEGGLEQLNVDQWVSKGLGGRKVAEQLINGGTKAMRSGMVNSAKLISLASSFCGEFTEESLSYIASYWMQRATYNKDAQFSWKELFDSGFMGGIVGLFGASLSLVGQNASSIATEYAAQYGVNGTNLDLVAVASRVDAWSPEKRAQESMGAKIMPIKEYAATAFGLAQADAAIRAANTRYDTFVAEAKAGIDAKSKRLSSLGKQITSARNNGDINKVGRLMRQYSEVKTELQKSVAEFKAQDATNLESRKQSIDQNIRAMEKANAALDSHDIALYNLFQEDINAMRERLTADRVIAAGSPSYAESGIALDAQHADDAAVDPDALDAANAKLLSSQDVIQRGERRIAQADAVLNRTMEKMRAARGGNVAEFLEGQMMNGIMDANAAAQAGKSADAPDAPVNAAASSAGNSASKAANVETEVLQPVTTPSEKKAAAAPVRVALTDDEKAAILDTAQRLGREVEFRDDMRPWEDGFYENGKLVLNSNQKAGADGSALKSTVGRILTHELTHSIEGTDDYAKFADYVCQHECKRMGVDPQTLYQGIIDEYDSLSGGEVKLDLAGARKEVVAKYAESYLLTDENRINTIVREQSGFAGHVLNWIQYQIAKIGARTSSDSDAAMSLLKAERLYVKAFAAAGISPNEGLREYAVRRTTSGQPVAVIETNILDGVAQDKWVPTVVAELEEKYPDGVTIGKQQIAIDKQSRGELTHSRESKRLERVNPSMFSDKLNAAVGADDVLTASTDYVNEPPKHARKDSIDDFARGKVRLRIGANDYIADVLVAHTTGERLKLYDIVEMKKAEHALRQYSAGAADANSSPTVDDGGRHTAPFIDNMPQGGDVVNGENNRQNSVSGSTNVWDDYLGGTPAGNAMRDAQYASAVQKGDTGTQQRMVNEQAERKLHQSKARDDSGKLIPFFHGTFNEDGHSVFDPSKSSAMGFFFTDAKDVARTYTGKPNGDPSANNNALHGGAGLYYAYLDMKNPMVIDCNNSAWDHIQDKMRPRYNFEVSRNADGQYTVRMQDFTGTDEFPAETFSSRSEMMASLGDLGQQIGQELMLEEMDFDGGDSDYGSDDDVFSFSAFVERNMRMDEGSQWRMVSEDENDPSSTDDFVGIALDEGYDGVIFKNLTDVDVDKITWFDSAARGGDTVAVVFSSDQIKSADPVTYDDAGNVIPLSRRFDPEREDIRWSVSPNVGSDSSDPFADLVARYGSIEPGRKPHARDINVPQQTTDTNRVGLTIRSILESSQVSDDLVTTLQQKLVDGEIGSYTPVSNRQTTNAARAEIAREGIARAQETFSAAVETGTTRDASRTVAIGEQLLAAAAARGDAESSIKLVSDLCILGTELGRSVQAFNMLKDMGALGSAYYAQRTVDRLNTQYSKQIDGGKMQPITVDPALMNQLLNAKTDVELRQAESDLSNHIAQQIPPTLADRLSAWRYFAMLANPRTHVRNFVGNTMMAGLRGAKNVVATGLEKVAVGTGLMQDGERAHAVYSKAAQGDRVAYAKEMSEKYKADLMSEGKFGFEDIVRRSARQSNSETLDAMMKFNTKLLEDSDGLFLRLAFQSAFTQYMVANGIEPASMTAAQESAAAKWAIDEAQRATFHDASDLAAWINRFANSSTGRRVFVEGVMPFKKTPINIAKRGIDYSPIGIVEGVFMATKGVKDGKYTPAQAVDRLASGLTGTALMALGAYLAKSGVLRGKGEEKDSYETFMQDNGEQLYSLNIGDFSMDLSGVAPATIPLFMGAALMEAVQDSGGAKATLSEVLNVMAGAANPLMEMSFLSSINAALESYGNGDGIGGNIGAVGVQAAKSYVSQYLPSVGGAFAAWVDPVQRTAKSSASSALTSGDDYFLRSLVKKIPGAASLLEPNVNVKGETTVKDSFGEWAIDFANRFILPGTVKIKDRSAVDSEIMRVFELTGETSVLPTDPPKYFTVDGKRINLTASQYTQYSEERGKAVYASLKAIVSTTAYKSASTEKQQTLLKKAIENAEGTVRDLWKEKLS